MDDFLKTVLGYVMPAYDVALAWIIDPANWVQVAFLVGAYVVGIGFGLQKIASNFVSGVILLLEGQATVGDYVELDGGEAGTIVKMTARAAILETFDGKWIVVPNEDFIVTWVINYSDSGSANRDEVFFP
jgi:small-conductance mechanosensitive channel